jgi:serine/threonine protein kinase
MVEFSNDGIVQKENGAKQAVIFIVLELATGGEFFDYIATGGRFNESIARFYFR